jgi:odorant receptor
MINFYWNRNRYMNIIRHLDEHLKNLMKCGDGNMKKIIADSCASMRKLTISFWICALITGNSMCLKSAIEALLHSDNGSVPLIVPSYFPFDDLWKHFWTCFCIQYYIMNIGMLIVPCWHAFIVAVMFYVILNLKILNYELCHMNEVFVERFHNIQIVKCTNDCNRILDFMRELSSLISSSLFLDFIIFSILLCMLLFQASQVSEILIKYSIHTLTCVFFLCV